MLSFRAYGPKLSTGSSTGSVDFFLLWAMGQNSSLREHIKNP